MSARVELDKGGIKNKIASGVSRVQSVLDAQVLKDSNYFAPKRENTLIDSSIQSTRIGSGELIWNTPYAKAQYYGFPNKSKDSNPNASMLWFEEAKSRHKEAWINLANSEYYK